MPVPGRLEAAFDADLTADPLSWAYTDLTDLTEANAVAIQRGRSSSRSTVADPASASFPLRNGGGNTGIAVGSLTPRKGTGAWYPGVRRGLPLRYSFHAGASTLALTGEASSNATTPDAASWNIGADLAVAVQFRAPVRLPPFGLAYEVMGQFTVSGNQRSWLAFIANSGAPSLRVSTNGTNEFDSEAGLAVPSPDAGPLTVAWVLDGDNGASGNTTTFYVCRGTIAELLADPTAFLFGDPDINSGTVTLHNSTGTVGIGDVPGSGFAPYPGGIDRVYVRAGTLTTGTVVADADFTAEAAGTGSFADDAATPKTWTINSPAEITDRKIRLLGEYGGNRGDYPGAALDGTARRTITVAGPLRRMRQGAKPLRSALYRRVTAPLTDTTVHAYWPLEDGRDATILFTIGGTPGGTMAVPLAADDTLAASEALPSVSGGQPFGWNLALPPVASVSTWEFTMFVNIPVAPVAGSGEFLDLCRIDCIGGVTSQWVLRIDDTNYRVFAKDLDGANVLSASGGSDPRMFGVWLIVTLTIGLSGSDITWDIDLTPVGGGSFSSNGTLASLGLPAGRPVRLRNLDAAAAQEGASFGHFIVTEGAVTGWLSPADTAYAGEPGTARIFRLCREQGIPVAVDGPHMVGSTTGWPRSIAAGAQATGPQRPLPLLDLLEEAATVGRGYLGEPRELLGISYRDGSTLLEQDPTISVVAAARDFTSADDDQHYVNQVEVSRPLGSSATYTATGDDQPLPDGPAPLYEQSRTINVASDADLAGQASWIVHEATWPEERHDTIPLEIDTSDTATVGAFCDLSAGDVIEATSLPDAAAASSTTQLVDGWTETVSPHLVSVRPNTRPAGPQNVGFLDDDPSSPDTDAARIDSSGTTLTGTLSGSATGGQSVTVAGTLWTTAAAYFPMNVRIDEEVVTLSGISGASSPQTFTISARGAAGTEAAAHAAGAEIHPARPLRVAPSRRFP